MADTKAESRFSHKKLERNVALLGLGALGLLGGWALRPNDGSREHDAYFAELNRQLQRDGEGIPILLLDLDRLDANADLLARDDLGRRHLMAGRRLDLDIPARAAQRAGHATSHGAEAHHPDVCAGVLVCHERLLRVGHLKPSACGTQVVRVGMKVSSMRIRPCTQRKGLSSRVRAESETLDTLEVTNSRPPTGGVIMPSVRL